MAAKTDKLSKVENGDYSLIKVGCKIAPIVYKEMLKGMEEQGYQNESTYLQHAIKKLNDNILRGK